MALLTATFLRHTDLGLLPPLLVLLALSAAALNSLIVKAALRPAERLVRQLERVRVGTDYVRVEGDPMTRAIAEAVNHMVARLEESRRQAALLAFQAEQRERSRIAHDLHDDVSQRVAALARSLDQLPKLPPENQAALTRRLADDARTILELLRRTMAALHPLVLDDLGLYAALSWLVQQEVPELECQLSLEGPEVDPLTASVLFRVAQEALVNIRRHAGARTVWLRTQVADGELVLEIEDDGCGIPPERLSRPGYGLRSMRERVQGLGGGLEIWSQPGKGTAIRVSVPLSEGGDVRGHDLARGGSAGGALGDPGAARGDR